MTRVLTTIGTIAVFGIGAILCAQSPAPSTSGAAAESPAKPPSVKELMSEIIFPTSNAVFYIYRGAPKDEVEWTAMRTTTLTLAESANLLMMDGRAPASGSPTRQKWMEDARLLADVGALAYKAAQNKDADALMELNEQLYTSCVACHQDFRPGYRRRVERP